MKLPFRGLRALLAGAVSAALILTTPMALAAGMPYEDVAEGAWYEDAVEYCWSHEIMDGVSSTSFAPSELMTRGVLAEALYRLADEPVVTLEGKDYDSGSEQVDEEDAPTAQYPFSDVDPDHPYADAILWAYQEGIIGGYDDGTFGPDTPITREQIAAIFWQAQGRKLSQAAAPFTDLKQVSRWAINAVEWVWYVGLMSGKDDGSFDYAGYTTRAEGAAILRTYDRLFINVPDPDPETSPIAPNTYDNSAFVSNGRYLTYRGDTPSFIGVDVSSHQKQIDWAQVAASGVDFAMIRAGYRGYYNPTLNKDAYFDYNIQQALANGLEVGVYFFSQAVTVEEAQQEAYLLLEWIEDYDITYPVVFDWESVNDEDSRTKDTDGETVTKCALAFCQIIEDAGYLPMTYGSPSKVYAGGIQLEYLQNYPFWLAHYTKDWEPTSFRYHYDMWQYSSTGSVPGIQGNVDLDLCLTDFSQWNR